MVKFRSGTLFIILNLFCITAGAAPLPTELISGVGSGGCVDGSIRFRALTATAHDSQNSSTIFVFFNADGSASFSVNGKKPIATTWSSTDSSNFEVSGFGKVEYLLPGTPYSQMWVVPLASLRLPGGDGNMSFYGTMDNLVPFSSTGQTPAQYCSK